MRNAPDIRVFLFPTKRYIRLKTQHNNQTSSPCLRARVCVSVYLCECCSSYACVVVFVVVVIIAALAHHLCS